MCRVEVDLLTYLLTSEFQTFKLSTASLNCKQILASQQSSESMQGRGQLPARPIRVAPVNSLDLRQSQKSRTTSGKVEWIRVHLIQPRRDAPLHQPRYIPCRRHNATRHAAAATGQSSNHPM